MFLQLALPVVITRDNEDVLTNNAGSYRCPVDILEGYVSQVEQPIIWQDNFVDVVKYRPVHVVDVFERAGTKPDDVLVVEMPVGSKVIHYFLTE